MEPLTFERFSVVNLQRAHRWHRGGLKAWPVERWSNAAAGEMGEICNAVKKLNRLEDAMQQHAGDTAVPLTVEQAKVLIGKEIGDTVTYLDLLAQRLGMTLEGCLRHAFNGISEREGFPERV